MLSAGDGHAQGRWLWPRTAQVEEAAGHTATWEEGVSCAAHRWLCEELHVTGTGLSQGMGRVTPRGQVESKGLSSRCEEEV